MTGRCASKCVFRLLAAALALGAGASARADDPPPPKLEKPDTSTQVEANKSYAIPAAEIVGFQFLLNRIDRSIYGADYAVTAGTIQRNLRHSWVVDNDPFKVNQLGHPYQGSIYHGFARSAGLGFWESMGYTFAGSMIWEIAGEDTLPSKNDQIGRASCRERV